MEPVRVASVKHLEKLTKSLTLFQQTTRQTECETSVGQEPPRGDRDFNLERRAGQADSQSNDTVAYGRQTLRKTCASPVRAADSWWVSYVVDIATRSVTAALA
ncbi:hypothetical protein DPEC_G00027970 [Dallia pectoralis]|uniref:Uncharacterized protein n=1 Tax=Dallia pectoralis TaxID=75939 RepID=A0ACC2HI29_DALPE|nr:hypothetical protein DPEC_G00027970 [Dallia pectoralis]